MNKVWGHVGIDESSDQLKKEIKQFLGITQFWEKWDGQNTKYSLNSCTNSCLNFILSPGWPIRLLEMHLVEYFPLSIELSAKIDINI